MTGLEVIKILEDYRDCPVGISIEVNSKRIQLNIEALVSGYSEQFNKTTYEAEVVFLDGKLEI